METMVRRMAGEPEGEPRLRFAAAPLVAIWEVTRACDLACIHCRASAVPTRDPQELTTQQGVDLLREIKRFGKPLLVFTGGDPLKRPDLFELIAAARDLGLTSFLSPSGTPLLTHAALRQARQSGLTGVSISLDGSTEALHDSIRGVPGSFRWCIDGAAAAVGLRLGLQINTTISRRNLEDLPAMAEMVAALEARRWTLFLLVPTGRALASHQISPQECERVFEWLAEIAPHSRFRIKTTEGPHFRRVALQRGLGAEGLGSRGGRFVSSMSDGSGFVFISARGEIFPSGFLPMPAGNVKRDSLVRVYREHPLFLALRDSDRLKGRCGRCEFRRICGGSRARAYAATGDYLEEDPACAYQPPRGTAPSDGAIRCTA
ncbi:MAG TPA: radical SAM protein [Candidatus Polarisedimenticolia bacterium]|nr:radical SAM protein [Candidatus Polarisedimenticolia bacterium]